MGSRIEELQRREAAARHEVNELRGEITRLAGRGRPEAVHAAPPRWAGRVTPAPRRGRRPLRDFVPLKEQELVLVEFRRHALDHLAARPRASLGADLPALRAEFIQLLEHARYVVGGPGHGLVLKGFHLPRPPGEVLCRYRPVRSGSVMRVRGVSASSSPERPDHCMDRTIVSRYKLRAARVEGPADLRS